MFLIAVTENYSEVVEKTMGFWDVISSNHFYYGIFMLIVLAIALKALDLIYKPFKNKGHVGMSFLFACLKVFVIAVVGLRIIALIPGLKDFTSQIFMSSSLIVVVMGFVFQEGLSNIVHGFILSVFKPFEIGDRVTVTIDGETITGYVREINARHTVIQNILNSAHIIVPNAKLDTSVIGNNYFDGNTTSSAFMDIEITYSSDLEKAIRIMADVIEMHPYVKKARKAKNITDPVTVLVRDLGANGISLRASVLTETVEENFAACSDIRRNLVAVFAEEPHIDFAYPHMAVVQGSDTLTSYPEPPGFVPRPTEPSHIQPKP